MIPRGPGRKGEGGEAGRTGRGRKEGGIFGGVPANYSFSDHDISFFIPWPFAYLKRKITPYPLQINHGYLNDLIKLAPQFTHNRHSFDDVCCHKFSIEPPSSSLS